MSKQLTLLDDTTSMDGGAILSPDNIYRYSLWRDWDSVLPWVLWIMLNPSVADAKATDPTIRKCGGFTDKLGFGGFRVVNLYAFRATKPADMWGNCKAGNIDPIGPDNDKHIIRALNQPDTKRVILAWGAAGGSRADERRKDVARLVANQGHVPQCLGTTKEGYPRHPLMVPYKTPLTPFGGW